MLKQLTIKNLAIIDDITIDFEENLNVLTGETGAGKSIIIDAISLIFGQRASNDIIAYNKDSAFISAALYLNEKVKKYIMDNYDIECEDEFIISRTISKTSKSVVKINGMIVPLHIVSEISKLLVDISSQNEGQYIFDRKNHLFLLDSFIENFEGNFKEEYKNAFSKYKNIKDSYDSLLNSKSNEDELDYLTYKITELKDFNYTKEEVDDLNNEYKSLISIRQNIETFENISSCLDNDATGTCNTLYSALKQLNKIANNSKVEEFNERLNSIYLDLTDFKEEFDKAFLNENIDSSRIDFLSNEITKINRLKRKYNVDDLLAYKNKLLDQINLIENREVELSKLQKQVDIEKKNCLEKAKKMTLLREKYSKKLSSLVLQELNDLYLHDASFSIVFEENDKLTINGIDDVEFYMSANKGVLEKPLIKVASGGEVSRIMLGIKSVFTSLSMVDLIIFDEIDTGVSGKVALAMGKKMEKIAKSAQVLAITHLPQVAAMSDHHYYISKMVKNNTTKTMVKALNKEEKITEVARLLSGNDISDSFINSAKELISSK